MDKIIKTVLEEIEKEHHEAFIVGGFVRDYLLGIKTFDIDICTDALPKDLHQIFPFNQNINNYGGFNLKLKKYNIDITTYRKELNYQKRKPTEIIYITNLEEDILRRDFTINAICMDKNEKIIDLVNGVEDLNNHLIRVIGDISTKLSEDPLRILRAIRLSTVLDFKIEDNLLNFIFQNHELINTLSANRIKSELNKILLHKNFKKGLILLKKLNIVDFDSEIVYVPDICGMWAQLEIKIDLGFTKQERNNIINIRQIIKSGKINNFTLYKYGLYNTLVAGEILGISSKEINKLYNKLKLKQPSDLQISSEEIMELLNIKPSKYLKDIKNKIITNILNNSLKNNKKAIKEFLVKKGV